MYSIQKQMIDLLEGWLRHKSDMVNFEAARAICEMKNITPTQLTRSIAGVLYLYSSYQRLFISY
jgi:coatomer protein complex subunit gamma